jgi:hypothetical protein
LRISLAPRFSAVTLRPTQTQKPFKRFPFLNQIKNHRAKAAANDKTIKFKLNQYRNWMTNHNKGHCCYLSWFDFLALRLCSQNNWLCERDDPRENSDYDTDYFGRGTGNSGAETANRRLSGTLVHPCWEGDKRL